MRGIFFYNNLTVGQPPTDNCPGSNINLASCSKTNPTSIYNFKFSTCSVATVSSVSLSSGSAGDIITITGKIKQFSYLLIL